jgi:exodeoxyribonuclease-3
MPNKLRIASYNLNGIRSAISKGLIEWINQTNFDIYLFQEIKADYNSIPYLLFDELGYHHHWFPAQKKGYSGVGVLSKKPITNLIKGFGVSDFDAEGRVIHFDIDDITIVNTYFPSGSSGEERQKMKMDFLRDYTVFAKTILSKNKNVIISGDYNICHHAIDIHDPVGNKNSSGFLPEEREWMSQFVDMGFIDTFRHFYPDQKHQYSWWSYRAGARGNNKGWRIDYNMASIALKERLVSAAILPNVVHSDHCPVLMEVEI